jgi:hypothetical protein
MKNRRLEMILNGLGTILAIYTAYSSGNDKRKEWVEKREREREEPLSMIDDRVILDCVVRGLLFDDDDNHHSLFHLSSSNSKQACYSWIDKEEKKQ